MVVVEMMVSRRRIVGHVVVMMLVPHTMMTILTQRMIWVVVVEMVG